MKHVQKYSSQSMNSALTKNTCLTQKCFSAQAQAQALLEEKKESLPKKKTETKPRSELCHALFAKWIMSEIYSSQSIFSYTDQIFYSEHKFCSDQKYLSALKMLLWPNTGLFEKTKRKETKTKTKLCILTWSFSKMKHARKVFFSEHNSYTDQNSTQSMNSALTKITCLTQRCLSVQALF